MVFCRRGEEIIMKNLLLSLLVVIAFSTKAFGSKPYFESSNDRNPRLIDDSPPGTLCCNFKAIDPGGLTLTYSLEEKIKDWLRIEPTNGTTTVKKKIDREAMLSIGAFNVIVTNSAGNTAPLSVTLIFKDVNNKPPIMTNIPQTINITEDTAVNSQVYVVKYVDKDSGINERTEFLIHNGNEDGTFRTNLAVVNLNKSLDYDNGKRQYVLNITARNTAPPFPQTTGTLTINVLNTDDSGLNFTKRSYQGEVIKGSAVGTPVVQVVAYDLDNLGEKAEYEIYPDSNKGNRYKIDSSTGQISVNGQLELGSLTLVVTAKSKKHGAVLTFVTITVVAVRNLQIDASVLEGKKNAVVILFATIEASFNVTGASFAIESGNDGNQFALNATALGVGSVALDRETKANYPIVVKLTKNSTVIGLATINVRVGDINDNSPYFEPSFYNVNVSEDLPVGKNLVKVTANDPDYDLNGTVKYTITNYQDVFSIDNSTGQVALLKTLDHEKESNYVIIVQAYDCGTPPRTNSTNITINIVDVNDNSPVATPAIVKVSVNENVNIGFKVSTIVAKDADEGQNAHISYSILSGSQDHFTIDSSTGVITTTKQLSHKQNPAYQIVVLATDHGSSPRSTNVFVLISVVAVEENNFKPTFKTQTYLGGVYNYTEFGKEVLTVSAEDSDSGSNGEVEYEIISGGNAFFMHSKSGKLTTLASLEEGQQFILTVQATDRGSSPKVSDPNAMVHVFVLKKSHSVAITAGVSKEYLLANLQEFQSALDDLTNGKAFIKSLSKGSDVNSSVVLINVVDNKNSNDFTEKDYESIAGTLGSNEKQALINGKYEKWRLQYGQPAETSARTSTDGGISAVVGAMICLSVMIGIGGIIMIVILIKKKRARQRVRKAARVTFNDKPQFIDPVGKSISSKIENAQEAQEVIVYMDEETSSDVSDETDNTELKYYNEGYDDNNDDEDRVENFFMDGENVNFSTFLPPPPTHPPPAVPNSEGSDSNHESTDNEGEGSDDEYIHAVLPPHQDFADPSNDYDQLQHYNESPTHSVTDSTTNLVDASSYKNSLLHDPTFGFAGGMRASINKDLTTEL